MKTIAEHLQDAAIPFVLSTAEVGHPILRLHHEKRAASTAVALFFITPDDPSTPQILVQGMFRDHQVEQLAAEMHALNSDPRTGWPALAAEVAARLRDEAADLEARARELRETAALLARGGRTD